MRAVRWLVGGMVVTVAVLPLAAHAKTFQVYSHPKAVAAPTKPVDVKDLQPSYTPSELETIVGKTADAKKPPMPPAALSRDMQAADTQGQEVPVPAPVPPLRIIPPPSELAAMNTVPAPPLQDALLFPEDTLMGQLQRLAHQWHEVLHSLTMAGLFLFTFFLWLTSYRQYSVLKRAVTAAETAAQAASQASDAAQLSALMQTSLERPYVFLEPNIHGSVSAASAQGEPAQFTIKFSFRNHGKTPAMITDLQASGGYWASGYPDALQADSHTASQGMVVSPGDKSSPFTLIFSVDIEDLEKAYAGAGQLLFWGKLMYRDMFGEMRETAFCRSYNFDEKAFRMAQAEKLNYHS